MTAERERFGYDEQMGLIFDGTTCLTMKDVAGRLNHDAERIAAMNDVFAEIRKTIGGNTFSQELHQEDFDPESPWLPVGLLMRIDAVMEQEHRE